MADLINKKDSLNTGRGKLNEAITQSNEAIDKSTEALSNSESTQDQLDQVVIDGDSSVEAAQARVDNQGQSYQTLKERIDAQEYYLNVKSFGALGDGVTDDTTAIQDALDYADTNNISKIIFPIGTYLISSTLNVGDGIILVGEGANKTFIEITTNTVSALQLPAQAYRNQVLNMQILTNQSFGTDNAAIKFDSTQGGKEMMFKNLIISGFKYGFHSEERWWMNTLENVRFNLCDISFRGDDSTSGTSLNNIFSHCYSDRPVTGGFRMSGFKNTVFLNCNAGGRKGVDDTSTYAYYFGTNCKGMKIVGGNVEHHVASSTGLIECRSGSSISIDATNFFNLEGEAGDGWLIVARDISKVDVQNCNVIQSGTNLRGIYHINDSQLYVNNNDDLLNDIDSLSTIPMSSANALPSGTTDKRPANPRRGERFFDNDLRAPVWFDGSSWMEERSGLATATGDGTTTQFSIPHGLSQEPTSIQITPNRSSSAEKYWAGASGSNILITYATAPSNGADLRWHWNAKYNTQ